MSNTPHVRAIEMRWLADAMARRAALEGKRFQL